MIVSSTKILLNKLRKFVLLHCHRNSRCYLLSVAVKHELNDETVSKCDNRQLNDGDGCKTGAVLPFKLNDDDGL